MEYVFNFFEDDLNLLKDIQKTAKKMKTFGEPIIAAKHAIIDLGFHNWADEMLSHKYLDKIQTKINNDQYIFNSESGKCENINIRPIPIQQWALQINYAFGDDVKKPINWHYDTPDFVVVILLNNCNDEGGILKARVGFGEELELKLKSAGDAVILNGANVEHCVTQLKNIDSERITLILSLVDINKNPKNVKLDFIPNKINKKVIKDWLGYHYINKTMTNQEIINELICKL